MAVLDEQQVVSAFRTVFSGNDSVIRNATTIRARIEKSKTQKKIRLLLDKHSVEEIVPVLQNLLTLGKFDSDESKKSQFPKLTQNSDQGERQEPPATGPKSNSSFATGKIAPGNLDKVVHSSGEPSDVPAVRPKELASASSHRIDEQCQGKIVPNTSSIKETAITRSLQPILFPMTAQLPIFRRLQDILEVACWKFASERFREVLQEKDWDCHECVELNNWAHLFTGATPAAKKLQKKQSLHKPFADICKSLTDIRHATVHRQKLSMMQVLDLFGDAEALMKSFGNQTAQAQIAPVREQVHIISRTAERAQKAAGARTREALLDLARQRTEINRREQTAIDDLGRERDAVKQNVEHSLQALLTELYAHHSGQVARNDDGDGDGDGTDSQLFYDAET